MTLSSHLADYELPENPSLRYIVSNCDADRAPAMRRDHHPGYDSQLDFVMDRKLAAILAADVVGYSALMEADEAGTFDRLRAGRKELFEPEIARHHGRV